ncbi:MAG: pilin, partial [Rhodanobacteraceae bacterium]
LIRSQVSEGTSLAGGAETAVAEFYSNKGYFPGSNGSAGIAADTSITGKYVSQVLVGTKGTITATFSKTSPQEANAKIDTDTLVLSPITSENGDIHWSCTQSTVAPEYLPSTCRS